MGRSEDKRAIQRFKTSYTVTNKQTVSVIEALREALKILGRNDR